MKILKSLFPGYSFRIFLLVLTLIGSYGCEKVVSVDLNEASPRIVIEGVITDRRGPYSVSISKTGSYFSASRPVSVSGAYVILTDDFDNIDTLLETEPGIYITDRVRGIFERTYTLKVKSEGEVYEGTTKLSDRVILDSVRLRKSDLGFVFGNEGSGVDIHCFFRDPDEKNYYRIKVYKNDSINTENYRMYDDQYSNGLITELTVSQAEAGNSYRIELMSLDKATYNYYNTLADLLYANPVFGSTPANPVTNLSNGALGYFGSYSSSFRTLTVTQEMIDAVK